MMLRRGLYLFLSFFLSGVVCASDGDWKEEREEEGREEEELFWASKYGISSISALFLAPLVWMKWKLSRSSSIDDCIEQIYLFQDRIQKKRFYPSLASYMEGKGLKVGGNIKLGYASWLSGAQNSDSSLFLFWLGAYLLDSFDNSSSFKVVDATLFDRVQDLVWKSFLSRAEYVKGKYQVNIYRLHYTKAEKLKNGCGYVVCLPETLTIEEREAEEREKKRVDALSPRQVAACISGYSELFQNWEIGLSIGAYRERTLRLIFDRSCTGWKEIERLVSSWGEEIDSYKEHARADLLAAHFEIEKWTDLLLKEDSDIVYWWNYLDMQIKDEKRFFMELIKK